MSQNTPTTQGASPDLAPSTGVRKGVTALCMASGAVRGNPVGKARCVELLLAAGADPTVEVNTTGSFENPLAKAMRARDAPMGVPGASLGRLGNSDPYGEYGRIVALLEAAMPPSE